MTTQTTTPAELCFNCKRIDCVRYNGLCINPSWVTVKPSAFPSDCVPQRRRRWGR